MNTEFLGRLHPLLVHFPIGVLFLAFVLEMLSNFRRFRKIRGAVPFSVVVGLAASIFSSLSGWFLSQEGGYEPDLLFRHRLFGFMTVAIAFMLWVVITYEKNLPKPKRRPVRMAVFLVMIVILTVTGHFGGSITHGRGYLSTEAEPEISEVENPAKVPELVFQDIVKPILDKKCVSCHGGKKQKGKLRLDTEAYIVKGGKQGSIVVNQNGKNELIHRISLPVDHEDHMPPREKEQLTNLEVELLSDWIKAGAPFQIKVEEFKAPSLERFLQSVTSPSVISWWPEIPAEPADDQLLKRLENYGVVIQPLSRDNLYLEVRVPSDLKPDASFWKAYAELAPVVVTLDLSGLKIGAQEWKRWVAAKELRKLYLTKSVLQEQSLNVLQELPHLRYLNLVSTGINYEQFKVLSGHPSLREVYVFGNNWSAIQIQDFMKSNPVIRLDTGNRRLPFRLSDTIVYTP